MPHPDTQHEIICPNCGYAATRNYCAQCGQETHLHRDTFRAMLAHFAGHYFHYDSKFWKTLKALWFSPGKLTKEYHEGKRARSISPIPLYIFISAVFFITSGLIDAHSTVRVVPAGDSVSAEVHRQKAIDSAAHPFALRLIRVGHKLQEIDNGIIDEKLSEQFDHALPKLFFFMIPLMAWLLHLFFLKRKEYLFGNHAIFSLHLHAFFFSIFLLQLINPFSRLDSVLTILLYLVYTGYFILALKKVYTVGYGKAVLYTLLIGLAYAFIFMLLFLVMVLFFISY